MRAVLSRKVLIAAGAIVVVCLLALYAWQSRSVSFAAVIDECEHVTNKALCYTDHINDTLAKEGLPRAFDLLSEAYGADPNFASYCHANTHELGAYAYDVFHRTGTVELTAKTSYCGYGFYHGFMEALLVHTNDLTEARAFCHYVGEQVPTPPGYAEGACYHGIGHGVTDGSDPALWGSAERLSQGGLLLCTQVAAGNIDFERRCDSGVFNSVALMYRDPTYKLDVNGDPYALCKEGAFSGVQREACFDQMNTLAVFTGGGDFAATIGYTDHIVDLEHRDQALRSASGFFVQYLKQANEAFPIPEIAKTCSARTGTTRAACIDGLVEGIMEFGKPGEQYKEVDALCGDAALGPLAGECFTHLVSEAEIFYPKEQLSTVCVSMPSALRPADCSASS